MNTTMTLTQSDVDYHEHCINQCKAEYGQQRAELWATLIKKIGGNISSNSISLMSDTFIFNNDWGIQCSFVPVGRVPHLIKWMAQHNYKVVKKTIHLNNEVCINFA